MSFAYAVGGAVTLLGSACGYYAGKKAAAPRQSPFTSAIHDMQSRVANALSGLAEVTTDVFGDIMKPVPERECQKLRDIARSENLDVVQRGSARVERRDGALIAEWDGEQITRYAEGSGEEGGE
jgi:hypothetical protein